MTDSESGVGADPDAHADSAADNDSEARFGSAPSIRVADVVFGSSSESGSARNP